MLEICRTLAEYFEADMNAAKPEQVGRLPGYTNCKEKYRKTNGKFSYVLLRKWTNRFGTLNPLEGAACNLAELNSLHSTNYLQKPQEGYWLLEQKQRLNKSQSEKDFAIACQMVRNGKSDVEIADRLEKNLYLPGRTRKTSRYISITIANARRAVARDLY